MEKISATMKGMYRDVITGGNNTIVFDSGWRTNKIVDDCRIFLAALVKSDSNGGISSLKVGAGSSDWDSGVLPPPDGSEIQLIDPSPFAIPAANLNLVYLDQDDKVVTGPTNRLQVTATLGENEPPVQPLQSTFPLREFGIFGKISDADREYMIDCIRHPVIHKDKTATLIRVVRLYF